MDSKRFGISSSSFLSYNIASNLRTVKNTFSLELTTTSVWSFDRHLGWTYGWDECCLGLRFIFKDKIRLLRLKSIYGSSMRVVVLSATFSFKKIYQTVTGFCVYSFSKRVFFSSITFNFMMLWCVKGFSFILNF